MNYYNDDVKKTMSVKEFSNEYGIGLNKAYEIVNSDKFPVIKCGRKFLIIKSKVDEWFEDNIGKVI
ncbi:helix-turn-helix domain-containing protein [Clostridium sp. D53t1_180928_C8]|uniref:helix-turn-helix domain-containing protein n=1 Tax=Clostridium sp. D53t1_180928_C8 TaxID=2787101 RepID=UPI0018AB595A|nr:helix-turn-helix domain-containing protein [Clostridium sp. D53t1_180928_C8]